MIPAFQDRLGNEASLILRCVDDADWNPSDIDAVSSYSNLDQLKIDFLAISDETRESDHYMCRATESRSGYTLEVICTPSELNRINMTSILLLHLLPRLQSLDVAHLIGKVHFMDALQMIPDDRLPTGLLSIQEFDSLYQGVTPSFFYTLLRLPRIRGVTVRIIDSLDNGDSDDGETNYHPDMSTGSPWPPVYGSSNVTGLAILFAEFPCPTTSRIFKIPRALETLWYETSCISAVLPDLGRALQPLRNSLQVLYLICPVLDMGDRGSTTIGTLRGWPVLTAVTISLRVLVGGPPGILRLEDVLPAGIRALTIVSDPSWSLEATVDVLVGLLSRKHTVLPALNSLKIPFAIEYDFELCKIVVAACQEAGVEWEEHL